MIASQDGKRKSSDVLPEDFYERTKHHLYELIGRELRLAGTVVDVGCGSCDLVKYLAETYRQRVTGVDVSPGSFPRTRHTRDGVRFRCLGRDARHVDFAAEGSIDAVVSTLALHEMRYPGAILAEAYRILRPGGEILVVDFPRGSLAQKLWNEDYYSSDEIVGMLEKAGFRDIRARLTQRRQIAWATGWKPPVSSLRK